MRSGAPYGETNPLKPIDFEGFVRAGDDPQADQGEAEGETGRPLPRGNRRP
jgi:hypothetical protein